MSEQEPEKKRRGRPPKVKTVMQIAPIQNSTVNESAPATEIAVVAPIQLEVGKVYKFMGEDIAVDSDGKAILMSIVPFEVMKITASKIAVKFAFGSIEVIGLHLKNGGERVIPELGIAMGNGWYPLTLFQSHEPGLFQ